MTRNIDRYGVMVCSALAALTTTLMVTLLNAAFHVSVVA